MNTKKNATYEWLNPCIADSDAVSEDAKQLINYLIILDNTKAKALESGVLAVGNKHLIKKFGWYKDKLNDVILECIRFNFFQRNAGKKWHKGEKRTASEYTINYDVLEQEPKRESLKDIYARRKAVQKANGIVAEQPKEEIPELKMELPKPYIPASRKEQPKPELNQPEFDDEESRRIISLLPKSFGEITPSLIKQISWHHYYLDEQEKRKFGEYIDSIYSAGSMNQIDKMYVETLKNDTERYKKQKEMSLYEDCLEYGGLFD